MRNKMPPFYRIAGSVGYNYSLVNYLKALLDWDSITLMPAEGAELRAQSLKFLTQQQKKILNNKKLDSLFNKAEINQLNAWQVSNFNIIKKQYDLSKAIPSSVRIKHDKRLAQCTSAWNEARRKKSYSVVANAFQSVIQITREIAQYRSDFFKYSPFFSLIFPYDNTFSEQEIDSMMNTYERFFIDHSIAKKLSQRKQDISSVDFLSSFSVGNQHRFCKKLSELFGFSKDELVIVEGSHPFCADMPSDIRIAMKYDSNNIMNTLSYFMHELGHALYRKHLPVNWRMQPVGFTCSPIVDEAIALIFEQYVKQTPEFINELTLLLRSWSNKPLNISPNQITSLMNNDFLKSSSIRINSGELAYLAHTVVRYQIEKKIIEGEINAKDMPDAFQELVRSVFQDTISYHETDILQDMHWFTGWWGYYPIYFLGKVTAFQLNQSCKAVSPQSSTSLADRWVWLIEHVFTKGSLYTTSELIQRTSSSPLNFERYLDHLKEKLETVLIEKT